MWLIVAEKDIAARRIAQILFGRVRKVSIKGVPLYLSRQNAGVIGLKGHIIELDFPKSMKDWRKTPLLSLISARLVKKVRHRKIVLALKAVAKKVRHVTVATDYDREGELIGLEAVEVIRSVNPRITVDRARFSAITPEEIRRAFSNRQSINYNLASAALARQKIDLIWGCTLTRLVSLMHNRTGKGNFLSAGRVQSPVLRIIVEREEEIKNFKPVKYWQITLVAEKDGIFIKVPFEERFLAKEIAESVLRGVDEYITVESFQRYTVKEERPSPFNTTEFLREASRFFSPEKAMEIAERLYMKGYISYPRTDNTVYPRTLNLASILKALESVDVFRKHVREILSGRIEPSRGKKETKDHPPIHPVAPASRSLLSREEWIIYELVCRRFLATLSKPCIWEVREAVLSCGKLKTKLKGKVILSPGWRSVYTYSKAEEVKIPELSEGEKLRVVRKIVEEKETKPPKRYSEGEIIKIMERLNLGTKATRHEILKKLKERRYVVGNPLRPTEDAYTILDTLKKIAEEITLPDMTAELERKMDLIEEGKLKEHEVVMESSKKLKELISKHVNNLPHNIQR